MTDRDTARPLIGAALDLPWLERYRDFILERDRDLELRDFHRPEVLAGDWRTIARRIKAVLGGYRGRLGIHGPFWGFGIAADDPEIRAVVRKRLDQALDVCADVGATHMVVHSPYTTWDFNNLDDDPDGRAAILAAAHDTLRPAVARAEALGCTIVIENVEDKDPHARVALAKSFESPAVRVSLDTGHAHYAHVATGGPPVDYFVHAAGDLLAHVHVQDADGHADRHWAPGDGTIRWAAVFRALAALPVTPRLVLELRWPEDLPKAVAHLQGLGLVE